MKVMALFGKKIENPVAELSSCSEKKNVEKDTTGGSSSSSSGTTESKGGDNRIKVE